MKRRQWYVKENKVENTIHFSYDTLVYDVSGKIFSGDAVTGLNGNGLLIKEAKVKGFDYYYHHIWTPEPIACYRDGKLLGIWEPSEKKLRSPKTQAEAPPYLPHSYWIKWE